MYNLYHTVEKENIIGSMKNEHCIKREHPKMQEMSPGRQMYETCGILLSTENMHLTEKIDSQSDGMVENLLC